MENFKLDRRRKYYMILDCETATLPCASEYDGNARKKIAIAKPLIYDLAYTITDKNGNIYGRRSFLITEIFSVPSVFNTAYYAYKRPIYLDRLAKGETILTDWRTASAILETDLALVDGVGAYNSMFDFKKALPFTELYINNLYSPDFYKWEARQKFICDEIASGNRRENPNEFDPETFRFRGKVYKLFDVWGMACEYLLDNDEYREACYENRWYTESGKYFKTSAETAYRFCANEVDFIESHTAIDDAEIETFLFSLAVKQAKNKVPFGITYFPFRILGTFEQYEAKRFERNFCGL